MSCDEYRELISAAIDGEITEFEARALDHHLAQCAACTRIRAQMRDHHQCMRHAGLPAQPSGLRSAVRRRLTLSTRGTQSPHSRCEHIPMMAVRTAARTAGSETTYAFGPCGRA